MEQTTEIILKQKQETSTSLCLESGVIDVSTLTTSTINEPSKFYFFLKRLIDIMLVLISIPILILMFLVIAICIKMEDEGDILYFREIIGHNNQRFFALKFRTMIPNADAYLEKRPELMQEYLQNMKLKYDPRITRVGRFLRKTSLDEFPQLFNVLIGQMSLVGPRMIHPSELPRYGDFAQKRLSVKPGITGLWQISRRQHSSYDDRIQLDMQYIDNLSIFNDLVIIVKTLKVFIVPTGV